MFTRRICFWVLGFSFPLAVTATIITLLSSETRGTYSKVSKNTRLLGNNFTVTTRSFLQCVVTCSITQDCSGINFCKNTCELLFPKAWLAPLWKTESCWMNLKVQIQDTNRTEVLATEGVIPSTTPSMCQFTKIGNGCYHVSESKMRLSYTDGDALCSKLNSELASLETMEEFDNLRDYLRELFDRLLSEGEALGKGWLIAARQGQTDGIFFWSTGPQVVREAWGPDQPGLPEKECVVMRSDLDFKMRNVDCASNNRQYICEL